MSKVKDQRRQQRYRCSVLVHYSCGQIQGTGFLKDLSDHGALLLCEPAHQLEAVLFLTPSTASDLPPTGGRVVWSATDDMTERQTAGIEFHTPPRWVSHRPRPDKEKT